MRSIRQQQAALKQFTKAWAQQGQPPLTGMFFDRHEGQPRLVILAEPRTDSREIERLLAVHFPATPYKIILSDQAPEPTGIIRTGSGIQSQSPFSEGTVGGRFMRQNDPNVYGLSNNHVIGHCNRAQRGDLITDPMGNPIGNFEAMILLDPAGPNTMDAAIFKLNPTTQLAWHPQIPAGGAGAQVDMAVKKIGAATQETHGVIKGIGNINIKLCGQFFHFVDIISIRAHTGAFSGPGDSGSLVMTENDNIVGVLFAKMGEFAYACKQKYLGPLKLVL